MDFSRRQPFLTHDRQPSPTIDEHGGLDRFKYEVRATLPPTVIQGFRRKHDEQVDLARFELGDPAPSDSSSGKAAERSGCGWQKLKVR